MRLRDWLRLFDWRKTDDRPGILKSDHYHAGYFDSPDLDLQASQERHLEELFLRQSPKACDIVVDVGCGQGNTARWLRRRFASSVVGIDIFDAVLQNGRAVDDLPLAQSDMANLPFRTNSVDLIVGVESVYGLPQRQAVFDEFARALRPGGTMLLSEYMLGDEPTRFASRIVSAIVHSKSLSAEADYRKQLHAAGFTDIAVVDVGKFTAVGTAAFLKAHPEVRHELFRAQFGPPRGALLSVVGFALFYKFWCNAFRNKRSRHVFVTARRPI